MRRPPPAASTPPGQPPATPPAGSGGRGRIEPTLDAEALLGVRERRHGAADRRGHAGPWRWWWWSLALLFVVGVALLLWLRQPLADRLWPQTQAQQLRVDAALALQEGRLSAPDGSGARELYAAALALDPDQMESREGLSRVGQAALERAREAIEARRYTAAEESLRLARELTVPAGQADALARQLRQQRAGAAGIDRLLAFAAAARAAGRLDGSGNAALPLYQRVLARDPHHTEALEGREDTLAELLQQALQGLERGNLAAAASVIERVQAADPGHVELPDALAELTRARERTLDAADAALDRDRLPNALDGYRALTAVDPDDSAAARGVERVAEAYARRSARLAADFRFEEAEAALREARAIGLPDEPPAIAEAEQALARARRSQSRLDDAAAGAGREAQVRDLLAEAAAAEARGDLLAPPGDSAFDKLRVARSLAPADPAVRAAAARLLPAAQRCFETDLSNNRLSRAGACLDARSMLGDSTADVRNARRRLARRWIAVGEQQLGAGEVAAADAALESARRLDAGVDGLEAFAERVRAASAAAD